MQLATFGRRLTGVSDALVGYRQSIVGIDDPEVDAHERQGASSRSSPSRGAARNRVPGALFPRITDAELAKMPTPTRSRLTCGSRRRSPRGLEAWVYVDARSKASCSVG